MRHLAGAHHTYAPAHDAARLEMWDAVRALVREATTVLLTTRYLEEANHLADAIRNLHRHFFCTE